MFDIDRYLDDLIRNCQTVFGERLLYVGLQGSYLRGEAREDSDIDVMVILDRFTVADMDAYRDILQRTGFYDLLGTLTDYLPPAARTDELNYVKVSLGNLYHELCHRYIHRDRARNAAAFRGTCKNLFFLIQNLHFLETGRFLLTKEELKEGVSEEDRRVLALAELPDGFDFDRAFGLLFAWCQEAFTRLHGLDTL